MTGEGILSLLDQDKVEKQVLFKKEEALIGSVCHHTPLPGEVSGGVLPSTSASSPSPCLHIPLRETPETFLPALARVTG